MLKGSASHKLVSVAAQVVLPAGLVTHVTVAFQPLMVGPATATLKLEGPELGLYEWDLELQVSGLLPCFPLSSLCTKD